MSNNLDEGEKMTITKAELREIAVQMILAEVRKGYAIDEAVERIISRRQQKGANYG